MKNHTRGFIKIKLINISSLNSKEGRKEGRGVGVFFQIKKKSDLG